jgi:hypothetical protein
MGRSLSSFIGYGILFLSCDELYQEESILNAMKLRGIEDIYDFFESSLNEENQKEENPCELYYSLIEEGDFTYGIFIYQIETKNGNYYSAVNFDPEKLAAMKKHDEFLIRVASTLGITGCDPGWFSVSNYG